MANRWEIAINRKAIDSGAMAKPSALRIFWAQGVAVVDMTSFWISNKMRVTININPSVWSDEVELVNEVIVDDIAGLLSLSPI